VIAVQSRHRFTPGVTMGSIWLSTIDGQNMAPHDCGAKRWTSVIGALESQLWALAVPSQKTTTLCAQRRQGSSEKVPNNTEA
jgi:hypothetical protein